MAEPPGSPGGDWRLAVLCVTILVGAFGALAFLATRASSSQEVAEPRTAGQKRRGALDRMQRGAARAATGSGEAAAADDDADGVEDGSDGEGEDGGRAARRNAQKEQRKQDKRAQQQADRQVRQERESVKTERQQKYSQKQHDKEAERRKQEEEDRKAHEEKERKEKAEFDQWKAMFAVEAEGEDEAAGNGESAVERFVDYVKLRKVVNLEDLAAEFRMRTAAAIDRLRELEKLGRISGIFDDRGKYIYITTEEMAAVADWINKKGRIGRAELVATCNRIIRLNPTEEDKARLEAEARSAAASLDEEPEEPAGESPAVAE